MIGLMPQSFMIRLCAAAGLPIFLLATLGAMGGMGINGLNATDGTTGLDSDVPSRDRASEIRYGRDIRPILSDRCFLCHGPDRETRRADLRLDGFDSATRLVDDFAAIIPGDSKRSPLMARITSTDPDEMMPPPGSDKHTLSPDQVDLIARWIDSGAPYEAHWAFESPVRAALPETSDDPWCENEIDAFILERMRRQGISPNPEADAATLCRRLFLDLTGLPPSPKELLAFVSDFEQDRAAYGRLVDRLLNEEPFVTRHAERMATPWLDLARYADTSGIHMDAGRSIWLWRDWVLEAYRDNKPFDEFVREQLAGDLIPEPTVNQLIASGFNRNHVTTDEGGAIDEEYLFEYAVDRANTTGSVFLGLSVGCARCHDHKFDPVSIDEYYSLIAFFNNNDEPGLYSQLPDPTRAFEPSLEVPDADSALLLERLKVVVGDVEAERASPTPEEIARVAEFVAGIRAQDDWRWDIATPISATSREGTVFELLEDHSVLATGSVPDFDEHVLTLSTDRTDLRAVLLEVLGHESLPGGRVGRAGNGNAVLASITGEIISRTDPDRRRALEWSWAWADVEQDNDDFKVANALRSDNDRVWALDAHQQDGSRRAVFTTVEPFGYEGGSELVLRLEYRSPYPQHEFGRVRVQVANAGRDALANLPATTTNWYITGPFSTSNGRTAYMTEFGPEEPGPLDFIRKFGTQEIHTWRYAPLVLEAETVSLAQGIGAEYLGREIYVPTARTLELNLGSDDGLQIYRNGTLVHQNVIDRGAAPDQDRVEVELVPGRNTLVCKVINTGGAGAFYHRALEVDQVHPPEAVALTLPDGALDDATRVRADEALRRRFSPRYLELSERLVAARDQLAEARASVPKTMIMKERAMPRETYVMMRGQYDQPDLDRPVSRGVPAVLGAVSGEERGGLDRLDLADWMVGDENPLTARVTVNRFWEIFFGRGIVETSADFGLQGAWPTHPELLDWLAVDFRENDWDMRAVLRRIVTSATYRQSSRITPETRALDPLNESYGWFPRQRLAAEQIRDQALYVADLLVEELGGPSVKPYQPEGLWQEVAMLQSNTRYFERSEGDGLWRRSLYTYWKRAAPPPSMLSFDAPTREYCVTSRMVTNTPLQALVLWNDEQFVEASRKLAERTIRSGDDDDERMRIMVLRAHGSTLEAETRTVLLEALEAYRLRYEAAPDDAAALVSVGESKTPEDIPASELAAWTMLANALLASDAAIVKD